VKLRASPLVRFRIPPAQHLLFLPLMVGACSHGAIKHSLYGANVRAPAGQEVFPARRRGSLSAICGVPPFVFLSPHPNFSFPSLSSSLPFSLPNFLPPMEPPYFGSQAPILFFFLLLLALPTSSFLP
jgi:hypothetical protein